MLSLISLFFTIFFAELGDKTQITTMLFTSNGSYKPFTIFIVASLALCASTAFAVLAGHFAQKYIQHVPVKLISGIVFVLMGIYTIYSYFSAK